MWRTRAGPAEATMAADLLLRGGRILDPASGRDEVGDLLLRDGRVDYVVIDYFGVSWASL